MTRQAKGTAAAAARGVKFGRPPMPLLENFALVCKAWREKQITLKQAADACSMPLSAFYYKATQFQNPASN